MGEAIGLIAVIGITAIAMCIPYLEAAFAPAKQNTIMVTKNWNENKVIGDGKKIDLAIPVGISGTSVPEYIIVSAPPRDPRWNSDALCLTHVSSTPGDSNPFIRFADSAIACGADWYESNVILGDKNYKPRCIWIDADHSNGLKYTGLAIHMPDFRYSEERLQQCKDHAETLCNSISRLSLFKEQSPLDPAFYNGHDYPRQTFDPPLLYYSNFTDFDLDVVQGPKIAAADASQYYWDHLIWWWKSPNKKSSTIIKRNSGFRKGHFAKSSDSQHSATNLCSSANSVGPDFVAIYESLYCDMEHKKLWSLCNKKITFECFSTIINEIITIKRGVATHKTYHTIQQWD